MQEGRASCRSLPDGWAGEEVGDGQTPNGHAGPRMRSQAQVRQDHLARAGQASATELSLMANAIILPRGGSTAHQRPLAVMRSNLGPK